MLTDPQFLFMHPRVNKLCLSELTKLWTQMHLILQCAVQLPNEMKRRRSKRNILKGIRRDYQCYLFKDKLLKLLTFKMTYCGED